MTLPDWWPSWDGETCVIVASGPSAVQCPIDLVRGRARVIAINNSWRLAPWADILFACDFAWWDHANGCPEFEGLKLTVEKRAAEKFPDVRAVNCTKPDDRFVLEPKGTVGWGGNSGFHALNLAVQFGCMRVLLVGFDMTVSYGLHWHGRHPGAMSNPTFATTERWRRALDGAAPVIAGAGVEVINCSAISALQNYPKMSLERALGLAEAV